MNMQTLMLERQWAAEKDVVLVAGKPVILPPVRLSESLERKALFMKQLETELENIRQGWGVKDAMALADRLQALAFEAVDKILEGRCAGGHFMPERDAGKIVMDWFLGENWQDKFAPLMR